MAFTIDQRKDEYFTFIVEEGEKMYASWRERGMSSKRLTAKAQKYAHSRRLTFNLFYRVRALIFLRALELRLEKRYANFLKKLLLLCSFLRERSAFRLLKRMLGHASEAQIRDLISVEVERLAIEVSKLKDTETASGGRTSFLNDTSILMELQSFFDLCMEAETLETKPLELLLEKLSAEIGKVDEKFFQNGGLKRAHISVDGVEKPEGGKAQGKETSQEKTPEKREQVREESKTVQSEQKMPEEKVESVMPSTSIPSEIEAAFPKEEQEEISPFPIFREEKTENTLLENKGMRDGNEQQKDAQGAKEEDVPVEKSTIFESEKEKSPFPIFRNGKEEGVVKGTENLDLKDLHGEISESSTREKMFLSYENQARLALRDSLSDAEKHAIARSGEVAGGRGRKTLVGRKLG